MNTVIKQLFCLFFALSLVGCGSDEGGSSTEGSAGQGEPTPDITAELNAYYADNPDFFGFKTPADIPVDLVWEDGSELSDLGSPDAKKGGTLYSSLTDFPRTLRVVGPDSNGSFRNYILDDLDLPLARRHPDHFVHFPSLAESWALSKDEKTVYIKLKPDALWSDGVPVTSDDMLFMFFFYRSEYILAPWYNANYSTRYTNISKYDDHTISISLPESKPNSRHRALSMRPLPAHFFKELGSDYVDRYQWKFKPTTGPYIIKDEDIKKGRSITLTRIKDWWGKDKKFLRNRFNFDRIHLSVIRDNAKRFEAFRRGDLDQFGLNLAEYWYDKLSDDDADVAAGYIHKSQFYNQRPRPTYGLWINTARPGLDNLDVRVGIQHAANWDLVIKKFFRGDYVRMNTSHDGYGEWTNPNITARPFDIALASQAFARAGYDKRGPDGIRVNSQGQRLTFSLTTGYESLKDVLTILKEEAIKAGLELRIEVLDGTTAWKKVQEKKHDIQFSAFGVFLEMYPRFWDFGHSDNAYDNAFLDDGSVNPDRVLKVQTNNLESMAIPKMDELVDRYRASSDKAEMLELAYEMDQMRHDYASFVPGFVQPFYRVGHWRWMRYPEFFNHKHSEGAAELYIHWIDTDIKKQTQQARKDGVTFPPQIRVYDQFK